MSKLQDIRDLAQEHAVSVSGSPRDWMDYMDTASRLYRYSFSDQLLIHAQRPDATACASLELWNEKMLRWVNRGARGIALFDETWQNTKLRYVFSWQQTVFTICFPGDAGLTRWNFWKKRTSCISQIITVCQFSPSLEMQQASSVKVF